MASTASLINHTWGVELLLDVTGLAVGRRHVVRYLSDDADALDAGSFLSVADVTMKCRFNGARLRDEVSAIEVVDEAGDVVMRTDLA
ncbi:hypothetical protein BH24ACT3_BH24ACT3_13240 [soil metagenome]